MGKTACGALRIPCALTPQASTSAANDAGVSARTNLNFSYRLADSSAPDFFVILEQEASTTACALDSLDFNAAGDNTLIKTNTWTAVSIPLSYFTAATASTRCQALIPSFTQTGVALDEIINVGFGVTVNGTVDIDEVYFN